MTYASSYPSALEQIFEPLEKWQDDWRDEVERLWVCCSQCGKQCPATPSTSRPEALAKALALGWRAQCLEEEKLPRFFDAWHLENLAGNVFCPRCSAEFSEAS